MSSVCKRVYSAENVLLKETLKKKKSKTFCALLNCHVEHELHVLESVSGSEAGHFFQYVINTEQNSRGVLFWEND